MIYEKRQVFPLKVSVENLSKPKVILEKGTSEDTVRCQSKKPESFANSIKAKRARRSLRRFSRSMRKRRHGFSSAVIVAVSLMFCLVTVDFRLYDGKITNSALSGAKSAILYALGEKETQTPNDITITRTIYTIPFSQQETEQTAIMADQTEIPVQEPTNQETAVAVSGSVSPSSLDGVKYFPITTRDLSAQNMYALSNGTGFDIEPASFSGKTPKSLENISVTQDPLVLVLHTHGCECYSDYDGSYPENAPTRSEDASKNVTRVGMEIAQTLANFGISSIHCDTLHDKDSFINAYNESAKTVKEYLEKYPSIKFVIDVHRDAIIRDDGESVKAVADIAGEKYAQIMFVVGTNELGHNHPEWKENLCLAVKLQESISQSYPGLCRNINLRNVPFNQQLSSGYLLVEVGTSANTLDEALLSARAFGQELARVILE